MIPSWVGYFAMLTYKTQGNITSFCLLITKDASKETNDQTDEDIHWGMS